jgi:beta-glucosidase
VDKAADGGLDVHLTIRNSGSMDADEVPQVYLGAPSIIPDGVQFPVRALVGFERDRIAAGTAKEVAIHVAARQLQYWSTKGNMWVNAAGQRVLSVGASSRDLHLQQAIN